MDVGINIVVPAASALIGALAGALISGRMQVQSAAMAAFIPARLEAYRALESAIKAAGQGLAPAVAREIYEAINTAALVASDETLSLLHELTDMIRMAQTPLPLNHQDFFNLRKRLAAAMRKDLLSFPVPRSRGM